MITLKYVLLFSTIFLNYQANTDSEVCENVCQGKKKCVDACMEPFDQDKTSDLSLAHCGIGIFDTREIPQGRMLNGQDAKLYEFPWMVSLQVNLTAANMVKFIFIQVH